MPNGEAPWLANVEGEEVRRLITEGAPVLRVPAGPGTGKTFGLRKRVLRILHPAGLGAEPGRVLVCAFNRVIARDLRDEIAAELEPFDLDSPSIRTVHGLAAQLAGERPRFVLPHEIDTMVYDILAKNAAVAEQFGRLHRRALRALREHESGMASYPALAQETATWLADHGAALVGDLPRRVEAGLRAGDYADTRFDHVIVDEFQDLTEVEARLAIGLLADGGSLVVLGDRKQSIYAFRGNQGRGLEALPDLVEGEITDRTMDECRRCPGEIVLLANAVMESYNEPLVDVRGPGAEVHEVHFSTPEAEHERLADEIVKGFRAEPEAKHLVLVTRRRWGYDLRNQIRAIAPELITQTVFSEDILETWPAREAFLLLSIVASPDDPATLRDWIAYKHPNAEGKEWKAAKRHALVYASLREAGLLTLERVRAIAGADATDLHGAGRDAVHVRTQRLCELLDAIPQNATTSEIIRHVLDPDRWSVGESAYPTLARDDIDRLRAEAESMVEEEDQEVTLDDLVHRLRNRIASREPIGQADDPDITIVTLWGAKGLTADFTYIVGLCDEALPGHFDPHSSALTEGEHIEEQRRLLYVSLTRAKRGLVISRPVKIRTGLVPALGLRRTDDRNAWWQYLHRCQFLADLPNYVLPEATEGNEWPGIGSFRA